jgi:elongator complex protein 1
MYDFSLVLLVAQHAQKVGLCDTQIFMKYGTLILFQDPREYLPFVRELRALEKYYQRFRIDDHLKRYKSALRNLHLAGMPDRCDFSRAQYRRYSSGPEHFDDLKAYVEKHQLYEEALEIFHETDKFPVRVMPFFSTAFTLGTLQEILNLYGGWLFERREFAQSALGMQAITSLQHSRLTGRSIYGRAETTEGYACIREGSIVARTVRACTTPKGGARGLGRNRVPCSRCVLPGLATFTLIINYSEDLVSKKRYIEAGRVLFDYAEDEREAVIALVQGNQFSEARRIVSCHLGPSSIASPTTKRLFR